MSKLTEDEREKLIHHIGAWRWESRGLARCEEHFIAEVEAIITARLARVEALAADLGRPLAGVRQRANTNEDFAEVAVIEAERRDTQRRIRAALAAAPSREGES